MSSTIEQYVLTWNKYEKKISNSINEILNRKELIDVTLVADGYVFNVHRLILSAASPYFRQMFIQMPVNQQIFVFLKDISNRTLDDLITFIYSGEVSVNQKNVNEFLDAAKAFKIKGLCDDNDDENVSKRCSPAPYGSQHQSTQTVPFRAQDKYIFNSASSLNQPHASMDDKFEFENLDEPVYEIPIEKNEYFNVYGIRGNEDEAIDQQCIEQNNEWNIDVVPTRPKRIVRVDGYDTFADIRTNGRGGVNLFHNGYKFHRNGNKFGQKQNWQCTKHNKQCRASASTMEVDGITMVKISIPEHSHDP